MSVRGLIVGALFVALIATLIGCWLYGRRLVREERTDAVFGNPVRALGGWHWVVSGVATILLVWLVFSWDAARAFFPEAGNELCQVAKLANAVHPMRSVFPFESRELRGTEVLHRERGQLERLERTLGRSDFTEPDRAGLLPLLERTRALMRAQAAENSVNAATRAAIVELAGRIDGVTAALESGELPEGAEAAIGTARAEREVWGGTSTEIPTEPISVRGALFDAASTRLSDIAADFRRIRNLSERFERGVAELDGELEALGEGAESEAVRDFVRQLDKLLKRLDDGTIFPPKALDPIEDALARLEAVQRERQGVLGLIDALAMPGGSIVAGNTACTEQGSGRWLPKPSDTLATLARISDPDVGYKGVPLLWYRHKPLAEMVGFVIPDRVADLVPGVYPRHGTDGFVEPNLKTRVLDIATGNFASPSIAVPTGHVWDSILRVVAGLFLGIALGVPLGLFMGLSRFAKGFFDPLIELYRPVPPLAWAPLILTIFGIQDDGKIFLLFMVAFAIMVISARTGASGTQLSKIHAAHSLGASKWQIVRNVILPNSLPEILTGIRISIGVCWGTLVAAEMLAGTTGIGFVENVARKSSDYEIIWVTIIILGLLGLLFDLIMRWVIARTIPWRGKG